MSQNQNRGWQGISARGLELKLRFLLSDHVDIRRKCNSALGDTTTYLKTKYNAVVLKTNFERKDTEYDNIHFSFEDQKRYNEIIFIVARRLLCDVCSWNPKKSEIQRERNTCKK